MTERLLIDRIGHRGDGVAQTAAGAAFVPYSLPGESVEAAATPGHADRLRLLHVDTPSPERVAPICPHFGVCGGCPLQHWASAPYRAWKRALVADALARAGIDAPVAGLIDAHGEGRRRAVFHARRGADHVVRVGFAQLRSHDIVAIEQCPVLAPAMTGAIVAARAIAAVLSERGRGRSKPLDIQVTASESGLDVDLRGSGALTSAGMAQLAIIAERHRLARLTRHGELVLQRAMPTITIGRARVPLPAGSFLQATESGEHAIAGLVAGYVAGAKKIADLFCGVGPFALRLAERAHIIAADNNKAAVDALNAAARTAAGLKPIAAQQRDLFRRPFELPELKGIDAVVFDPPREGAEAQARALAKSKVPVIVAVSCNAATFARDAAHLIAGGYRLEQVTPIDQFRYASHVELVACFTA